MTGRYLALWLLPAAALAACQSDSADSGVIDVDELPMLTAVEELRVGDVDDPDLGFVTVHHVDVDGAGRIYAYEAQQAEIRVFSPEGQLIRRIGRRGDGPGEFQQLGVMFVHRDTLWTMDIGLRRVTMFSLDGEVLATRPMPSVQVQLQGPRFGRVEPMLLRDDGVLVGQLRAFILRNVPASAADNDTVQVPRILFSLSGEVLDTAGFEPYPPLNPPAPDFVQVGSLTFMTPQPPNTERFSIGTVDGWFHVTRDLPTSSAPATFSVTHLGFARDTLHRYELRYRPQRYPDGLLDALAWRSARMPGGAFMLLDAAPQTGPLSPDSMSHFQSIRSAMSFPEFQPPVLAWHVANDGSLWLQRSDDYSPVLHWLLLTGDGSARGRIDLPRNARVRWHRGDRLITIETDELDVPWLVRYRIED